MGFPTAVPIRCVPVLLLALSSAAAASAQTPPDSGAILLEAGRRALEERTRESLLRSVELSHRAATLLGESGRSAEEAEALMHLGIAHLQLGRPDSALIHLQRAHESARRAAAPRLEAAIASAFGAVHEQLGELPAALQRYRDAHAGMATAGDEPGTVTALNNIGMVHYRLGQMDSALVNFSRAYEVGRELGDPAIEGTALGNLAATLEELGRPDSALVLYRRALTLRRTAGDRWGEVVLLNNIGYLFHSLGRTDSARVYYRRTVEALEPLGDPVAEGTILTNLGALERNAGRTAVALANYRRALELFRRVGDRQNEATVLSNLGGVQADLERPDSALAYYRAALAIEREIGARPQVLSTLNNIGSIYENLRMPDSASVYLEPALELARELGDPAREAIVLNNLGLVHQAREQLDSAFAYVGRAIDIVREMGDSTSLAQGLNNLGALHERAGRPDSARAYYEAALTLARTVESRLLERTALENLGLLLGHGDEPDLARALAYYDSAAAVIAGFRRETESDADRLAFAEGATRVYEVWALGSLARGGGTPARERALAALAAAERGRARALLDLLRTSGEPRPGADLAREGAALVEGLGSAVLSYLAARDTLLVWLVQPSGDVHVARHAVTRDTLARMVARLRGGLGVEGAEAASRLASLRDVGLELAPETGAPGRGLEVGAGGPDAWRSPAAALAELLLPPEIARRLTPADEVLVVPHGPLALVPFAALPIDASGTPLGAARAVRYAPSLAMLRAVDAATPGDTPRGPAGSLVVGNPAMPTVLGAAGEELTLPELPGAEVEARRVAARQGAEPLLGPSATEAEVRGRLPGAALVHLATHGYAYSSDARARDSFVALAPSEGHDGLLTVGEVLDELPALSAELVVLSACQTGLGNLKQAEGTVGLQRAFLARGARTLLVSLWSVSDEATRLLMERFYTHWLDDADAPGKAEALRRAQEDVRGTEGFEQPKYWAAFQVVGAR